MPVPDPSTAEGQKQMQQAADQRVNSLYRTFNEIQTGPNPLSRADVRKLIDRCPARYYMLENWATPKGNMD